ncbi:MAG: SoxR reducing system RseC family protein [Saccharospirillaceae bacterium]|nr:SoxR reducing system RseC family protein [Pseudomonadales bacterium]NRB78289.1 SoxR reducing system RseC family protein [Saccharospirillaceae bacterium]
MIVENAWVQSINNNQITLQTIRSSSCQSCKAKSGCGQALLSKVSDDNYQEQKNNITIFSEENVSIGEEVELILPENSLVKAALIMYLTPLFAMFSLALIVSSLGFNDVVTSLSAILGLGFGFLLIKSINNRLQHNELFEPKLRRKIIETT